MIRKTLIFSAAATFAWFAAPALASAQTGSNTGSNMGPLQGTPSAHGCVGFDGTWQSPGGTMHLHNGSGPYGDTTLTGKVTGKVLHGTWRHPIVGHGTFMFILAPDGDSFTTSWKSSSGRSGSFDTVQCTGPN